MFVPTRMSVPAMEVRPGDQLEIRDEDGTRRALVRDVYPLDGVRVMLGTSEGAVQVEVMHQVRVTRSVEV